jgi:hypothetical protein
VDQSPAQDEVGTAAGPPAAASWDPIVLDVGVAAFPSRPPAGSGRYPDTVVDGWSSDRFDVRLASIRGYSHRFYGRPRQDAASVAFDEGTGSVVFAVADGVSSARCAERGAELAVRTAVNMIGTALRAGRNGPDWSALIESISLRLAEEARSPGGDGAAETGRAPADFATTLVAGYARPAVAGGVVTVVQLGDSSAWLLDGSGFTRLLGSKSDPGGAAVIPSQVAALPAVPEIVEPVTATLPDGSVLLVGTDGFGDPLGDGTGLVGGLFRSVLRTPPPPLGFAHALDFSRETFDDDRTLVAVWARPPAAAG